MRLVVEGTAMKIAILIVAVVLLVLQAFGVTFGQFSPGWLGLAVLAGSFVVPPPPA